MIKRNVEIESLEYITHDNVDNIKMDNVVAFTFAYDGAMGHPGELEIAYKECDELKFYHINRAYNDDESLVDKVDKGFFNEFATAIEETGWLIPELGGWKKIEMGMGNYLFIRREYFEDFEKFAIDYNENIFKIRGILWQSRLEILYLYFSKNTDNKSKFNLSNDALYGALLGDIIGSRHEFHPIKTKDFDLFVENDCFDKNGKLTVGYFIKGCRFTDDSVMTLAICKALLESNENFDNLSEKAIEYMRLLGKKYPLVGYGNNFNRWLMLPVAEPYNSYGNGSAMRISAVPYFAKTIKELNILSKKVTEITHNHPEGIKGAEVTANCIWMAMRGHDKLDILKYVTKHYDMNFEPEELVKNYKFDETCQGSVPQAIFAFLISESYEDTIRNVVSFGGDADTMGAIAGAIAGAYFGVPDKIKSKLKEYLTTDLEEIVNQFDKYIKN